MKRVTDLIDRCIDAAARQVARFRHALALAFVAAVYIGVSTYDFNQYETAMKPLPEPINVVTVTADDDTSNRIIRHEMALLGLLPAPESNADR